MARCPDCGSDLELLDGRSSVASAIRDYKCPQCGWSAPKCGNTQCDGYMIGTPFVGGYYNWKCVKCGWSGEGLAFRRR